MKSNILFFIILCYSKHFPLFSQTQNEDSVSYYQNKLAAVQDQKLKGLYLTKLAWFKSLKGEVNEATEIATEAIPILKLNNDYQNLQSAYNVLGQIFQYQHNNKKAVEYAQLALESAISSNIKHKIASGYLNYALMLGENHQLDKAETAYKKASNLSIQVKDTLLIMAAYLNYSSFLFDKGDYQNALLNAQKGLDIAVILQNVEEIFRGEGLMGGALLKMKRFDEADLHFRSAEAILKKIGSPYFERQMKYIRTEWAVMQGKYKDAFEFQRQFYDLDTLLANSESKQKVEELETRLKTNQKEFENLQLKEKLNFQKWLFVVGVLSLFLVGVVLYFIRERQKTKIANELTKSRELLDGLAKSISEKNLMLDEFQDELNKQKEKAIFNSDLLLEQLNKAKLLTEEQWDDFRLKFEKIHPEFINRLHQKIPNLTDTEVQMACMTKLNFSKNQMAGVLGISADSITKSRYRLRKKIDQDDINAFISAI